MAFDEEQFPSDISRGASSRPKRVVDIVTLRSGHEQRNTIWSNSRRSFDVGLGLRDLDDIYNVQEFWEGRRGSLRGFRFKDWSDFKSASPNSVVASTDQATVFVAGYTYQFWKVYSPTSQPYSRAIVKLVSGSTKIGDAGRVLQEGSDYLVDHNNGLLYLGYVPYGSPTAGFEFDVPVRFQDEELEINVALFDVGSAPSINLTELRVSHGERDTDLEQEAFYNWLLANDINFAVNTNWNDTWGTL